MIGVGTDTGMTFVPQYATWRELELLVAYAGFSPAEALPRSHCRQRLHSRRRCRDPVLWKSANPLICLC